MSEEEIVAGRVLEDVNILNRAINDAFRLDLCVQIDIVQNYSEIGKRFTRPLIKVVVLKPLT